MASSRWPHPHAARWRQWLLAGSSSLLAFWSSVQISHRGKYSVERLQALDEYCKTTSLLRVLVVCCLTPVPAMALVLILECIPLRDPSEGWQRNFPTWMRVQVVSYSVAQGLMLQVLGMIPSIPMTISKSILVSVSTAVACVAVLMCLSATWVYPVPFGIVLGVLPFVIFFPFFFVLAVGRRPFLLIPNLVLQLQRQLLILLAQATLVFVYPSFNAIFTSLSLDGQLVALCVLPLIKILIKNIVAWSSAHLEDYIPEIVAFSVDVFNSLYVSACMKSAGRLLTTTLVMGFDAFQIVLALRDIQHRTTSVQRWNPSGVWKTRNGLLTDVLQLCQRPELLSSSAFQKIRLRSPIKLHLSVHGRNVLDSLVRHRAKLRGTTGTNRRRRTSVLFSGIQTRFKSQVQPWIAGPTTRHLASVAPAPPTEPPRRLLSAGRIQLAESSISVPAVSLKPASVAPQPQQQEPTAPDLRNTLLELPTAEKTLLIHETLTMLFQCEYLILVEYIESTVPLLYAIYNTAIYYLPNAKYYPQMAHITDGDIVTTTLYLFGYAFMETISFLAFSFALQRRFGFSPLYLLAFVLEKQMQQLQGRLFVWVVYILPFTLKHYGESLALLLTLAAHC